MKVFHLNYSILDVHLVVVLLNEKNHRSNRHLLLRRHHQFEFHRFWIMRTISRHWWKWLVQLKLNEENHIDQWVEHGLMGENLLPLVHHHQQYKENIWTDLSGYKKNRKFLFDENLFFFRSNLHEDWFAIFCGIFITNKSNSFFDSTMRSNDNMKFLLLRFKMNNKFFWLIRTQIGLNGKSDD
jgi:hypothetical protein